MRRVESGEWRVESGEWRVESGEWRVESGEWRVASGEWRVASGEWRVASGEWRVGSGEWSRVEWSVHSPLPLPLAIRLFSRQRNPLRALLHDGTGHLSLAVELKLDDYRAYREAGL